MKSLLRFISICVFSDCFCKDIIRISLDNDKLSESNESEDKNIKIEISSFAKNHSNENIIPISSDSGSLEHYEETGRRQFPWILLQKPKQTDSANYSKHNTRTILSSIEETSDLWADTPKDIIYSAKMHSEPQSDNIFHDKIMNSFENTRKIPAVMAKNYPKEITNTDQNQQEDTFEMSEEKVTFSNEENNIDARNISHSGEKKETFHNQIPVIRVSSRNESKDKKDPTSCCEKIPEPSNKLRNHHKYNNTNGKSLESMNIGRFRRKVPKPHKAKTDILQDTAIQNSSTIQTTELPTSKCDLCTGANESESTEIAIDKEFYAKQTSNSSIAVTDHVYQANKDTEESDDNDQETIKNYPYSVSVQRKGAHYASGALIGERWILSTAAEFFNVRETIKLFSVRVGSHNCKKGGILSPVKSIAIHPRFTPGLPAFDISALKTADLILLPSVIQPVGISRISGKTVTTKFLTTYWPRIVAKQGVVPSTAKERIKYKNMRVSTQNLVPTEECRKQLAAVNVTLDRNSLCLKPIKIHHSDCMPDIGAPVVAVDGLWGITSGWVAPQCPSVLLPTLFTRVSTLILRNWINEQINLL